VSTSSCPTADRSGQRTSSDATAVAVWSARKPVSIFPGWDPSVSYLIAEVEMTGEPEWGIRLGDKGTNGIGKLDDGKARCASC